MQGQRERTCAKPLEFLHLAATELLLPKLTAAIIVTIPEIPKNFRVIEYSWSCIEKPEQNKMQHQIDVPAAYWKPENS